MKVKPVYQSSVVVEVVQQLERNFNPNTNGDAANAGNDLREDDIVNTIAQSLKLPSLYLRVAKDPVVLQAANIVPTGEDVKRPNFYEDLSNGIRLATSVTLRPETRLIDVKVEDTSPEFAQKVAATIVDQFIAAGAENDMSMSSAKRKFLLDNVARTKVSLQNANDGLEIYKEALRQKQRVDEQQKIVDALSQRYLDAHPKLIEARSLMSDLKRAFDAEIKKVIASSPSEAAYWAQNQSAQPQGSPDDSINLELKLVEARTSVLQSEVNTESALFDSLLKQMREQDVLTGTPPVEVKVVDPANLPTHPLYPYPPAIIRNGILGGFAVGVIIVLIMLRIDTTFSSAEEIEHFSGLPVITTIPFVGKPKAGTPKLPGDKALEEIVLINDATGIVAENIRNLWASLELVGKEEDRRVTLFSSALPGEGKTFTSCNYAVSLAQHDKKTLLIDADLRRPSVHTRFKLKNNKPGFTEHVAQGVPLEEAVHKNVVDNLDVMLTGGKCPNPAEFLGGQGFAETIERALKKYDRVVIDSPPIILVSDTRLVAPYVQTICLVVKAQSTSRHAVRRALNFLEMANVRPIGIVYNCVPAWSLDEYYGYSYTEKYSYGDAADAKA